MGGVPGLQLCELYAERACRGRATVDQNPFSAGGGLGGQVEFQGFLIHSLSNSGHAEREGGCLLK